MKEFSRWAGELGFEYHVIEGFWSRWSEEQIKELVDYSRQRGVGLFFWKHSRQLRTPEAREEFFRKLRDLGVVGAKIDCFDHEHKEVVDLYTALLKAAARHRVMVDFHGANKPAGNRLNAISPPESPEGRAPDALNWTPAGNFFILRSKHANVVCLPHAGKTVPVRQSGCYCRSLTGRIGPDTRRQPITRWSSGARHPCAGARNDHQYIRDQCLGHQTIGRRDF